MGVDTQPAAAAPPDTSRPRRRRLVAAVLTVATLAAGGWWWSHPSDLGDFGGRHALTLEPGRAMYSGMVTMQEEQHTPLRVIEAEPRTTYVSAQVRARVVVCERRASAGVGLVPRSEIDSVCSALLPAAGHELRPEDQLVLEVEAESWASGGVAVFDGIEVTYSNGLQRGTEHTGVVTEVRVEGERVPAEE